MSYNLVCVLSFGKCLKSFCRICVFNCVAFNVCCREKSPHQVKVVSFLSLSHPALLSSNPVLLPPHHLLCIIWGALPKHKFGQFICVQLHQHQMARWYTWHKKSPEPEKVNLLEACWLRGFCLTCTCSHLATSFRTTTLLIIVAMDFWQDFLKRPLRTCNLFKIRLHEFWPKPNGQLTLPQFLNHYWLPLSHRIV